MLGIALIREVYFFPRLDLIPNPDCAWLLLAAQRLAAGEKLYVDIMETNPPLIIWLNLLPVYLARALNISPFHAFTLLVSILNLSSLWLVSKTIRQHEILKDKFALSAILLYIAFGFFALTPALYGQRETLFIALVLPYLFSTLNTGTQLKARQAAIIAMAAVGFAIKPFFMLVWGVNELAVAIQKRKFSSIFAARNWLIGFAQLAYFAAIYFITPEYFNYIIPALRVTYFTFESQWAHIFKIIAVVCAPTTILLLVSKTEENYKPLAIRFLILMFACAGLMVVQRKDWLNHIYPMTFMAGLTITMCLIYLQKEWVKLKLDIGHRKFVALCFSTGILLGLAYADGVFTKNAILKPQKISNNILANINKYAQNKYVYPFVDSIQPSFPAISISDGVFRGGFHHLWPMAGLIIREQDGDNSQELLRVKKWFTNTLVNDFEKHPPTLVWVDKNVNMEKIGKYDINPENRSIIEVLSRDARFAKIWKNYTKIDEIEAEGYPEDEANKSAEEKKKKPETFEIYIRKEQ